MPASLDSMVAAARRAVSQRLRSSDVRALERAAARHTPRGFRKQLRRVAQDGIAVIAELKKASPSKGLIRADFRPSELAPELERAGAAALSILTDEQFFQGSLDYLREASSSSSLPCLRKDFIVDEFQIVEGRANCADAILLVSVWGAGYGSDTQVLRAHIANLRRKIEPADGPRYIRTDPGVGYRFAG